LTEKLIPERQTSIFIQCRLDGKPLLISEYLVKDMDITDAAGYINDSRDTLIFRALTEASAARLKMFLELLQLTE
jgi:signal peptidase I